MSGYKRNQQGQFRNTSQDWRQSLSRRGEDVYGEGEDYRGEGYRNPNKPPFRIPYAGDSPIQQRPLDFRYGNARMQRIGFGQNYQPIEERDDGRGGWWEPERVEMPGYRSDEERRYGSAGVHRGKGPRNYKRSDERISEDINDRLAEDTFIDASDIEVTVRNCEVVLTGTVESRDAKRRAEDIGESVTGVKNVENRLRVKRNTDWTSRDGNSEDRSLGTQRTNVREEVR